MGSGQPENAAGAGQTLYIYIYIYIYMRTNQMVALFCVKKRYGHIVYVK